MPLEIEIKLKIDHLAPVRDRLVQLGATRIGERLETNIFFDTTDRSLLAADCGLRLRRHHDIQTGAEKLIVTFKGPRSEGPIKTREEIEVCVDNLDSTMELLERLGYKSSLSFEKRRETWKLDKCLVELDTMPELGSFVEIECPAQNEVLKIRQKLGLDHVPPVFPTYADLVARHLSDKGSHQTALTFAT